MSFLAPAAAAIAPIAAKAAPYIAAAGIGLDVYGQIKEGKDAKEAYEHNAEIDEIEAKRTKVQGEEAARQLRRKKQQYLSRQRAIFGASGTDVGVGSPLTIMMDTAREFDFDLANTAFNYQTLADKSRSSARLNRRRGSDARKAGIFGGISTGLKAPLQIAMLT